MKILFSFLLQPTEKIAPSKSFQLSTCCRKLVVVYWGSHNFSGDLGSHVGHLYAVGQDMGGLSVVCFYMARDAIIR